MRFIHLSDLHVHSNYSLLEGASHVDELVAEAVRQGHRALAVTDHDGQCLRGH